MSPDRVLHFPLQIGLVSWSLYLEGTDSANRPRLEATQWIP